MDNARFHRKESLRKMVRRKVQLLFLPAYSPDLNPIKKHGQTWNALLVIICECLKLLNQQYMSILKLLEINLIYYTMRPKTRRKNTLDTAVVVRQLEYLGTHRNEKGIPCNYSTLSCIFWNTKIVVNYRIDGSKIA